MEEIMGLILGSFEKARHYINTLAKDTGKEKTPGASVTLSRQTGAGADVISAKLVEYFKTFQEEQSLDWTVFDKNLINKILEDHNLPERLSHFYEEKKQTVMQQFVNDLFYGHSSYEIIKKTARTILQLVHSGNVIIVGMGGNVITAGMPEVFHVRVVAPLEQRIEHAMEVYNISRSEAIEFVPKEDMARKHYLKSHYHKDVDDPLLYDIIVNTGECTFDEATEIIGQATMKRVKERVLK
jgi:cytidylate kinase